MTLGSPAPSRAGWAPSRAALRFRGGKGGGGKARGLFNLEACPCLLRRLCARRPMQTATSARAASAVSTALCPANGGASLVPLGVRILLF